MDSECESDIQWFTDFRCNGNTNCFGVNIGETAVLSIGRIIWNETFNRSYGLTAIAKNADRTEYTIKYKNENKIEK